MATEKYTLIIWTSAKRNTSKSTISTTAKNSSTGESCLSAEETEELTSKNVNKPNVTRYETSRNNFKNFINNITIEPAVFLFTIAMSLHGITTQSLIIRKYCLHQMNLSHQICSNLTNNHHQEQQAQLFATNFELYQSLTESIPAIIWAVMVGPWSDTNGRKLLFVLPSIGGGIGMVAMAFIAYNIQIDAFYILIATLPYAVTGNTLSVMTGAISYVADITDPSQRTTRFGFVQASFLCGLPIGVVVGGLIFNNFGYLAVYVTSICLYTITTLYVTIFVKETVDSKLTVAKFFNVFNLSNIKEGLQCVRINRKNNGKMHVYLLIFAGAISFLPLYAEYNITYLYTRWKFQWDELSYSLYSTCIFITCLIGLLFFMPVMTLYFKITDLKIGIFSAVNKIINEVIIAISSHGWMLFSATPLVIISGMNSTVIRSVLSKTVSSNEQGKITSVLSAAEASMPIFGSLLFTQLYNFSRIKFAGAVFFMSAGLAIFPAICFGWIYFDKKKLAQNSVHSVDIHIIT